MRRTFRSVCRGGIHPSRALPTAANDHGGQRAGRPTYDPGRAADPRGVGDAASHIRCRQPSGLFVGAAYMRPAVYRHIPFTGQFVGEGFIPPGHLPIAANGHGGQRAGRPTYAPGRAADLRGIKHAAPTFIAVPPHNQKMSCLHQRRQDFFMAVTPVLLPVDCGNHAGQCQQRQQVRDRHQAVEQVGQRPDKINLQG